MENRKPDAESERRPYEPPQIIYEARLEVRAGSPLSQTDPLDPLNPLKVDGK